MMLAKKYSQPMTTQERIKGGASALPVIGDAISGYDAYQSAKKGDYIGAALNAVGMLPMIPALAGVVKQANIDDIIRQTMPKTRADNVRYSEEVKPLAEWFSGLLKDNGIQHELIHSGSKLGPSSYLRINNIGDEVRISNHSKGVFNNQFYRSPYTADDFIDIFNTAKKANPKYSEDQIKAIIDKNKLDEIKTMYPIRLKSADKKILKGKSLTKAEQEAIDWRNNGGVIE